MTLAGYPRKSVSNAWGLARKAVNRGTALPDGITVLTEQEAWELYDAQARKLLNMSAEEFERAWKRGDLRSRQEDPLVRRVLAVRVSQP
jgi:hypothetical protein